METMTEFQQRAAAAGLQKMFKSQSFSICTFDAIAEVMGMKNMIGGPDYAALKAIHCVAWVEMGPELSRMTREKCLSLLGLPATIIEEVPEAPAETQPSSPPKRSRIALWK